MKTVKAEFSVLVPDEATNKEIEDWLKFHLGATGSLSLDNPMSEKDIEAVFGSVQTRR